MALVNDFHLIVELHDQQGVNQHQFEVDDLRNCYEDFKFSAFSRGLLLNDGTEPCCRLEPLWNEKGKSPYCSGFRLYLDDGEVTFQKTYSKKIFRYKVFREVNELIRENELEEGMELQYRFAVFPRGSNATDETANDRALKISVQCVQQPMPILPTSSKPYGADAPGELKDGELNVWVADHVVTEMIEYVLQNKDKERAGFLIGHFCQDPEDRKLFLVCHDQLIARFQDGQTFSTEHESSLTHFQFSPETFFEVQRVIDLRRRNEIVLGWYHSHPWPFACQKGEACECTSVFFSAADFEVMEAAFRAPYQVAIVIGRASLEGMEATAQMYGWKDGLVASRQFLTFDARENMSSQEELNKQKLWREADAKQN